ncbi:MAG: hypothetical protein CMI04_00890 [Oceanospirillaceae bacterium]|nr:hypothetical protein [Oceanospirillaceae bacterium]
MALAVGVQGVARKPLPGRFSGWTLSGGWCRQGDVLPWPTRGGFGTPKGVAEPGCRGSEAACPDPISGPGARGFACKPISAH